MSAKRGKQSGGSGSLDEPRFDLPEHYRGNLLGHQFVKSQARGSINDQLSTSSKAGRPSGRNVKGSRDLLDGPVLDQSWGLPRFLLVFLSRIFRFVLHLRYSSLPIRGILHVLLQVCAVPFRGLQVCPRKGRMSSIPSCNPVTRAIPCPTC